MNSSEKTARRKALGQFFTPDDVAGLMARWVCGRGPGSIVDPAVGHCALLDACNGIRGPDGLVGFDIDDRVAEYVSRKEDYRLDFRHGDYLSEWGCSWDGIICNPPYMKFQRIPDRPALTAEFQKRLGIKVSGYTNLMGYFVIKGISELREGGRAAYLVPYEFLNNGYGTAIKECMLSNRSLAAIIRFDNSTNVFDQAITTSCILLLEKGTRDSAVFADLDGDKDLEHMDLESPEKLGIVRDYRDLVPSEKWLGYFSGEETEPVRGNTVELSSIGRVMRGIATGDNGFFTMNRSTADSLGISEGCLMPCICRSPDITKPVFRREDFEDLESRDCKVFLFNGANASGKKDLEYLRYGESTGVPEKYLTSHRSPWYSVEKRDIAPILIGAFGRDSIKVVMNEAGVSTLAPFHGLNLSERYRNEEDTVLIFSYLFSTHGQNALLANRREYGSKLDRYQPSDLNHSMVLDPGSVSDKDRKAVMRAYRRLRETDDRKSFLKKVDALFARYS